MSPTIDEITLLNSLIRTTLDSVEGYREAADDAQNPEFKSRFADRSTERMRVVTLLREQVQFLGGMPEDTGTLAGGAHRVFVNLKALATGRDDAAVIAEVQRGEMHLMKEFNVALEEGVASLDTLDVIEDAHNRIAAGYRAMLMLAPPTV